MNIWFFESNFEDEYFDVIFDKGTLDSISLVSNRLNENDNSNMDSILIKNQEKYIDSINRILKPNRFFIIISCNHDK